MRYMCVGKDEKRIQAWADVVEVGDLFDGKQNEDFDDLIDIEVLCNDELMTFTVDADQFINFDK